MWSMIAFFFLFFLFFSYAFFVSSYKAQAKQKLLE